ncbi:MAG: electron transfer flavoprotein subunit beta/FixA family protein [Candidatus Marinimicrobia bacterium]|nr:electron transfer flavoprotein subunit beta/FixA family protein [Candidatus Neomarinimicrobiota bacterium]
MKICVLIKQVPDAGSVLRIRDDESWVEEDKLVFTANESDSYALEEALLLKEAHGGEVIACTLGPERSRQVLKDALSKGADRAIFLHDESFNNLDCNGLAKVFAKVLENEQCDLILCGLQADDTGEAAVGPMLAQELHLPHVTMVVQTEPLDGGLKVKQELEGGWFRQVETSLPALLTIQSGINKPRYASLRGIMAMKKKELRELSATDLGIPPTELAPMQTLQRIYVPVKTKETVYLEGAPEEVVAQLVDKLANEAKVL